MPSAIDSGPGGVHAIRTTGQPVPDPDHRWLCCLEQPVPGGIAVRSRPERDSRRGSVVGDSRPFCCCRGHAGPDPSAQHHASPGLDCDELFLLAGAESSLRPTCGKAPKLPEGAYDGIQCHPAGISSVGFYAFDQREDARKLYFDRLAEYKVKPDSGIGCPGEGVDTPGNDGYELRFGCYVDENGLANARMLFPGEASGQSVYVGAVGKNGNTNDLTKWLFPDYEPGATGCGWCIGSFWSAPGEYH